MDRIIDDIDAHEQFANYFQNTDLKPIIYLLSKKMEQGHICLSLEEDQLKEELSVLPNSLKLNLPFDFNVFKSNEDLVSDGERDTPFVFSTDSCKFYLHRNFFYEQNVVKDLVRIANLSHDELDSRKKALIGLKDFMQNNLASSKEDVKDFSKEEKPDWQLIAAITGFLNNLSIVTGGPGTGKTTTVAKILSLLNKYDPKLKVALAAPTGKAAVRMKESLLISSSKNLSLEINAIVDDMQTFTIHLLLGTIHESPFFKHNDKNPLDYDVIIIDESSMLGLTLFAKLLNAIGNNCRLILLGDSEQLSSVEIGSMFGDMCLSQKVNENKFTKDSFEFYNSFLNAERKLLSDYLIERKNNFLSEHLIRLKKTYRYNQSQKIGLFTKAVINGEYDKIDDILILDDNSVERYDNNEKKVFDSFVKKYEDYIIEDNIVEAIKKFNKIRVLCAIKNSEQGVFLVNEQIERNLKSIFKNNPKQFNPIGDCYHNQPIIVTKNIDDLKLYNGDVGIIRRSEKHDNRLMAFFPIKRKEADGSYIDDVYVVNPGFISEYQTVFAMTIHKSQGSEYEKVMVILPKSIDNKLLTRELLYTGITRAAKQAIILGSIDILKKTTLGKVQRTSDLCNLIQNKI
jgi:exodeoxyribonuclease V alpha subunit